VLLHAKHTELVAWYKQTQTQTQQEDAAVEKSRFYDLFDNVVSNDLISSNEQLIEIIVDEAIENGVDELVFMVGSLRQCRNTDVRNGNCNKYIGGNSNGSFFLALTEFSEEVSTRITKRLQSEKSDRVIKVRVDPYLLSDDHLKQPHGTSFSNKSKDAWGEEAQFYPDATKLTILTAQTNKVGSESKSQEIENFNFCDDRLDILDELGNIYKKDPADQLIPININLRLLHYANGEKPTLKHEIHGKGRPDGTFSNSTQLIIANTDNDNFKLENYVAPEKRRDGVVKCGEAYGKTLTTHFKVESFLEAREQHWDYLNSLKRYDKLLALLQQPINLRLDDQTELDKAVIALYRLLSANITKQTGDATTKIESGAFKIGEATLVMLEALKTAKTSSDRLQIIETYEETCRALPEFGEFSHPIYNVAITALWFTLFASVFLVIGNGIDVGAFVSGWVDLFKGDMTYSAISLVVSGAAGFTGALLGGCLFFKPNDVTAVANEAKEQYCSEISASTQLSAT
jgi:hypothetical protein